jgi:hypothetical protein
MDLNMWNIFAAVILWRKMENVDGSKNASHDMGYLYEACDQISDLCHQ